MRIEAAIAKEKRNQRRPSGVNLHAGTKSLILCAICKTGRAGRPKWEPYILW
jgi:hypothetical protein